MSPAPPLASPGTGPGAELAAPSPALEQPLRGSPTPRPATGASTDTGHALAAPSPRNKRGASRPPPSADRRADDDSAVATGAGGAAPSPPTARAPGAKIPKKQRGGGRAPATARGGQPARRGRPIPASASALGSVADAVAAHRRTTERKAKAAQDEATAAREDAEKLRAAQDLLLGPAGGSPPLPSTAPVPPRPPPTAAPRPAAGGAPPGVGGDDGATADLVPGATAPAQGGDAFTGGRMGAVLHNPPLLDPRARELWDASTKAQDEAQDDADLLPPK